MARKIKSFDYNDTFPRRFRELLDASQDITQEGVAELVGVTRQTVGNWCSGKSAPDAIALAKIAAEFGVSIDWLLLENSPKQVDTTLSAVCRYTGLTEEAVKALVSLRENPQITFAQSTCELLAVCKDLRLFLSETQKTVSDFLANGYAIKISQNVALYNIIAMRLRDLLHDYSRGSAPEGDKLAYGKRFFEIIEAETSRRLRKYSAIEEASKFVNEEIKRESELCDKAIEYASLPNLLNITVSNSLDDFFGALSDAIKVVEESQNGQHPKEDD